MTKKGMEKGRYLYLYLITAVICVVIVVIVAVVLVYGNPFSGEESTGIIVSESSIAQAVSNDVSIQEESKVPDDGTVDVSGYIEISVQHSELFEGNLILVTNKTDATAPIKDSLDLMMIYGNKQGSKYSLSTAELLLNTEALNAFNLMMHGFGVSTAETHVMVNNAYASIDGLTKDKMFESYADLASGRSVRLAVYPSEFGKMGEGVYLWFSEHCHEYGYILRYPADKTEKTGAEASATMFRYVGKPHSEYIKQNNLSLEEYIELIKEYDYKKPLIYTGLGGEKYYIYYQRAVTDSSTAINVPGDRAYSVSGNNTDGFIVTVSADKLPEQ
ncbi:MAG: hypothetical protein PHD46_04230 [Eubacteriales bacterium]|nr:hypothetical protein [Eubacteriales bacterium]